MPGQTFAVWLIVALLILIAGCLIAIASAAEDIERHIRTRTSGGEESEE